MLRLPDIVADNSEWRLPLSNGAALGLVNALLAKNDEERTARLVELLTDEPTLVLWSVHRAASDLQTVWDVARWLSHSAELELQWPELADATGDLPPSADVVEQWAELAATSVGAMLTLPADATDEVRLQTLLAHARGFLGHPLFDQAAMKSRINAAVFQRLGAVRARWVDSAGAPKICLPTLMQRLLRLRQLEENFAQTLEREKLDSLKELAYGASHEINNPLANIATRAQTLLRDEADPERRRKLAVINAQAFRAHEMISDMMLFARPPGLRWEAVDLVALVDTVIAELSPDAAAQATKITRTALGEKHVIDADRVQLGVVIKAIVRNALEALGKAGEIAIEIRDARPSTAKVAQVEIVISDTGPGIPPEVRRHLFDPFYSGREAGRGLGFGLSKSWRIVTLHGGEIEVSSEPGQGSTFTVRIPRQQILSASSVA